MDPKYSPYPEPALIFPDPGGYMPLYSAAQWIASRAFEVVPDEIDEENWRIAYRSLLDAISAGRVKASGVRDGERQLIPPHAFAACHVTHWWEGYEHDVAGGRELYLRCGVYANDDQWRSGNDDALTNVREQGWRLILLSSDDVAGLWPPEKLHSSGGERQVPAVDVAGSGTVASNNLYLTFHPDTGLAILRDVCQFQVTETEVLRALCALFHEDLEARRQAAEYRYIRAEELADSLGKEPDGIRQIVGRARRTVSKALGLEGANSPIDLFIETKPRKGYRLNPRTVRTFPFDDCQ